MRFTVATLTGAFACLASSAYAVPTARQANHCLNVGGGNAVKIASSAGDAAWVYGSPEAGVQLTTAAVSESSTETSAFRFETNGRGAWQISPVTEERYKIAVHYEQGQPLTLASYNLFDSTQFFDVLCDDCTEANGKFASGCTIRPNVPSEPDCIEVVQTADAGAFLDSTTCSLGTPSQTFDILEA